MARIRKRHWLLGTLAAIALLVGFLALALARGWLLDLAINYAVRASDGRLVVADLRRFEGVLPAGLANEGFTIGRVAWYDPDGTFIEINDGRLQFRMSALLQRELHVFEMRASSIIVRTPPSKSDVVLPETLKLPLNATIESVAVDRLQLELGGGAPIELRGLRFGLDYRDRQYTFQRLAATADQGTFEGRVRIADRQPYAMDAEARLFGKVPGWPDPIMVTLNALGPLKELQIKGASTIRENPIEFSTLLDTLAYAPKPQITWSVNRLQPKRFVEQMPDYQFAVAGVASLVPVVSSSVELRNLDPGFVDAGKLPLEQASARLRIDGGQLLVENFKATLSGDGKISGKARMDLDLGAQPAETWRDHVSADLRLERVVPANLYRGLTPADLTGSVVLDRRGVSFDLRDRGPLLAGGLSARGIVNWDKDRLLLEQGELRARDGLVRAGGHMVLAKPHEFAIKGEASRFELHRWFQWSPIEGRDAIEGRLSGMVSAEGRLDEPFSALVDIRLRDSVLNGLPLSGTTTALVSGAQHISNLDSRLVLGGTRLSARGSAGQPGDKLDLRIVAESLAELDSRLAGRLDLSGDLRGDWKTPALRVQWNGTGLQYRQAGKTLASASSSRGSAEWSAEPGAPIALQLSAANLRADAYELQQLNTTVRGSMANHQFSLTGSGAGQQLRAGGSGELTQRDGDGLTWKARVNTVDSSGRVVFLIQQPMQMVLSPKRLEVEGLDAQAFSGKVRIEKLLLADGKVQARGDFASLLLDDLITTVQRVTGTSGARPAANAGISVRADGRFDIAGTKLDDVGGRFSLEARSTPIDGFSRANLTFDAGRVAGTLNMQLPSIAWARRFTGSEWLVDGRLAFDGEVAGTVRAPKLRGTINGSDLRLEQRLLGWRFADGVLKGQFTGDELRIDELRLAGKNGFISLAGALQLPEDPFAAGKAERTDFGTARFRLRAERLPLSTGPGQRFVLSGDTQIVLARDTMTWSGKLNTDEGLIELKDLDAPNAPDDLEIVDRRPGRGTSASGERPAAEVSGGRAETIKVRTDLQLDLGERFRVQGNGVDALLQGSIMLTGMLPGLPSANGTVQVRDGTYRAYGHELKIERGRLIFTGRLDNPTIDIVALRKFQPVEAGIALSGTALAPRSRLVSQPNVPDADKLSWLVLGVSLEDAGGSSQASALQVAAMTFFGNNDNEMSGGVAKALGLDVLGVRSASSTSGFSGMQGSLSDPRFPSAPGTATAAGTAQQNVVTVGKRLSSRLFVSYEQGLRGVWNLLKIQYDISNRFSLRALTGSESAIDLLYFFSFD